MQSVPPEDVIGQGWRGQLSLTFAQAQGHTRMLTTQTQAPLKVQRSFYPEGQAVCHSVMVHTAGGMVGSDRLDYHIHLRPQAHALLTTAAAHKVYRSSGATAQQCISIRAEAGSVLEWFPQETIVFNRARYRQDLRVELAPEAVWIGWDLTRFGRSARGEQFLEGNWRSHTEVWRLGQPLWIDRQHLEGNAARWNSPHGLAGYPVIGAWALVGQTIPLELVEKARELGESLSSSADIGTTRLLEGLLCRYRGPSTQAARRWFIAVWDLLRSNVLGRSACLPRVW